MCRIIGVCQLVVAALTIAACGPTMPPAIAPPQPNPAFDPFRVVLQAYIDQTQAVRKRAAEAAEKVPGKSGTTTGAETSVRTRQNDLAEALRTTLRPNARQGELFMPQIAPALRRHIAEAFNSPMRDLLIDELAEQNTQPANSTVPAINQELTAPRVPPRLSEILPPLPKQLEYDFAGRTLVLRDVDAELVIDFLPDALPELAPSSLPSAPPAVVTGGPNIALPLPSIRGGTIFALMGDSGSGDVPQQQVAQAMLTHFSAVRRFGFVLMLGDNLYHDDYTNEFLTPYKPLLDRGVKFYAALGNHDRDLQIHFKPFNMGDRDRYQFDQGNARFVALNSNHPTDPEQIAWLDGVFADAGDKWRIAFFHHPLYSSGNHASESAEVIRPALEEALVRNRVNVVFSGHEHLYERSKPQRGGVVYFVSGGGGRYLHRFNRNPFTEVGVSEYHFMVAEVAGDRLFFEAVSHAQKVLDCGVLLRTPAVKTDDEHVTKFQADCDAVLATPRTTGPR